MSPLVGHLVAIDLPGGPSFVDALRREWDAGNAVLPIDRRLPPAARRGLLESLAPDRLLDAEGLHRLSGRGVEAGDALVMATSGATGAPKGVVLTHQAVRASAIASSKRLGITGDDTWLACLPLAHVGGMAVITRAVLLDVPLIVHDGFDADRVQAAARTGATAVSLVPTALQRIDAQLFRVIVLGGARAPADRPANVHATYGLTETGSGVVYDGVPLDGVEVAFGSGGEVLLRCPMLLRCYRDGSTPVDADGWLHTGDLGEQLPDGRLHIQGRADDLIITGGENVWPEVVENVIATHTTIRDVAIVGVPDSEWGQRVVAWIVPNDDPPSLAVIRAHVLESLPAFCVPKELHITDALPRTALGKLQRHRLQ
ncbi:MAG: AMP-binding protein [Actinomycetia bacterium]|nr:AMP-binding protein [Actinomycetes bacterium]